MEDIRVPVAEIRSFVTTSLARIVAQVRKLPKVVYEMIRTRLKKSSRDIREPIGPAPIPRPHNQSAQRIEDYLRARDRYLEVITHVDPHTMPAFPPRRMLHVLDTDEGPQFYTTQTEAVQAWLALKEKLRNLRPEHAVTAHADIMPPRPVPDPLTGRRDGFDPSNAGSSPAQASDVGHGPDITVG